VDHSGWLNLSTLVHALHAETAGKRLRTGAVGSVRIGQLVRKGELVLKLQVTSAGETLALLRSAELHVWVKAQRSMGRANAEGYQTVDESSIVVLAALGMVLASAQATDVDQKRKLGCESPSCFVDAAAAADVVGAVEAPLLPRSLVQTSVRC
jgi:hypothetical protein